MPTSLNRYLDPAALDETVVNIRELIESLEEELQNLPYARPDGLYPDMTVGAVIGADSTAQWAQRESTGSGAATVRSVQGAAVAWNQLVKIVAEQQTSSGVTITKRADGTVTVSGAAASNVYFHLADASYVPPLVTGNKYLFRGPQQGNGVAIHIPGNTGFNSAYDSQIITAITSGTAMSNIYVLVNAGFDGELTFTPQLFDLTAMFGSGNEPTNVAEFERMYPEAYYPYSAPTLKPVQIAGIRSTDAQGGELDSVEWTAQTLRAAGSVADELTSDELVTRVGVVDLGTLTWQSAESTSAGFFVATTGVRFINEITCIGYENRKILPSWGAWPDMQIAINVSEGSTTNPSGNAGIGSLIIRDMSATGMTAAQFKEHMSGVIAFIGYNAANITTQPISPALPMTYKVQQGGSESIIVPDGEVSAAPVLTVAEPVNAGDEFARIWEAIQSLGYTRNTAQLSRPVSLTDIGSIDEVQKDTTDVVEIDTTKEVQE